MPCFSGNLWFVIDCVGLATLWLLFCWDSRSGNLNNQEYHYLYPSRNQNPRTTGLFLFFFRDTSLNVSELRLAKGIYHMTGKLWPFGKLLGNLNKFFLNGTIPARLKRELTGLLCGGNCFSFPHQIQLCISWRADDIHT